MCDFICNTCCRVGSNFRQTDLIQSQSRVALAKHDGFCAQHSWKAFYQCSTLMEHSEAVKHGVDLKGTSSKLSSCIGYEVECTVTRAVLQHLQSRMRCVFCWKVIYTKGCKICMNFCMPHMRLQIQQQIQSNPEHELLGCNILHI